MRRPGNRYSGLRVFVFNRGEKGQTGGMIRPLWGSGIGHAGAFDDARVIGAEGLSFNGWDALNTERPARRNDTAAQ